MYIFTFMQLFGYFVQCKKNHADTDQKLQIQFTTNIRINKQDLGGMVLGTRWADLSISE